MFSLLSLSAFGQDLQQDTPGFAFLGAGYDILSGNPLATDGLGDAGFRENIFEWTYDKGLTTTDQAYRIADKTNSRTFSACSSDVDETVYNSAYSYQHIIDASFDMNIKAGGVEFSLGIDVRNTRNHTDDRSEIYAHLTAVCTRYQLDMYAFDQPNVTSDFARGMEVMPLDFDMDQYAQLISVFGTHYVQAMKAGGRWGQQMTFKSEDYQALIDNYIDVHAGLHVMGEQASGGFDANITDDKKTTYDIANAVYKNTTFSTGGDYSPDPAVWMASVKSEPMPIHMTLKSLDTLMNSWTLPNMDPSELATKKANFMKAADNYCDYMKERTPDFTCEPPQPIPDPTPTPIGDNAVRAICVKNSGGYLLYIRMTFGKDPEHQDQFTIGAQSDSYPAGQMACVDGTDSNTKRGDYLGCKAQAVAGREVECQAPLMQYDPHSRLQANYVCNGSTLSINCYWNGVSAIGAEGDGRRRRMSGKKMKPGFRKPTWEERVAGLDTLEIPI